MTTTSSTLRTGTKFLLAIAAGTVVGMAVQTMIPPAGFNNPVAALWQRLSTAQTDSVVQRSQQSEALLRTLQVQAQAQARLPAPPRAAVAADPRVETHLVVGGTSHAASNGPIALHSGTQLQVRLTPNRSGVLELHAINSLGETAGVPLWTVPASAGSALLSPVLRLQGERGMETLQGVLRSPSGQVLTESVVQLWHE